MGRLYITRRASAGRISGVARDGLFLATQQSRIETNLARLARTTFLAGALVTGFSVLLVSNSFTYIDDEAIVTSSFDDLSPHRFTYEQVEGVRYSDMVRGSGWEYRDIWRVRFEDGFDFVLDPAEGPLEEAQAEAFAWLVAERAGTEVRELTFIPETGDAP